MYYILDSLKFYAGYKGCGNSKHFTKEQIEKALAKAKKIYCPEEEKFLDEIIKSGYENIEINFG